MENNHTNRAHALLSPSSAKRWMNCPGSLVLGKDIPEPPTSDFAAEGTYAHECADKLLRLTQSALKPGNEGLDLEYLEDLREQDRGLADYVEGYVDFCNRLAKAFETNAESESITYAIEKRFHLSDMIWGTSDFCIIGKRFGQWEVAVVDFKYGQGVQVKAEDNEQLIIYGLGVMEVFGVEVDKLRLYIYQPRGGGDTIRRAVLNKEQIGEWLTKIADSQDVALEALSENKGKFSAGSWCRFCKCAPVCPEIHKDSLDLIDPIDETPLAHVSLEQLVQVQKRKKQIEHLLDAVESHLTRVAESGVEVPGYKIVPSKGKRSWAFKGKELVSKLLEKGLKEDEMYKKSVITLLQAEKILGKDEINDLVSPGSVRNQLVSIEDEREQVDINLLETI